MIIGIVGPTGSGKSDIGIALAKALDSEIISVDAYQIYTGMDVGTAKISPEQKATIPHHFIDHVPPWETYDVAQFQREARAHIDRLTQQNKPVLMVGGAGYYLKAVLHDFQFHAPQSLADVPPPEQMWEILNAHAPVLLEGVHPNNHKRLINRYQRYLSETPPSAVDRPLYPYQLYGLKVDTEHLKMRTNARIDAMIEDGLEKEVRTLLEKGLSKTAAEAIGYKEWRPYFKGAISKADVIAQIKVHTHQYIKKQMTYFNRQLPITWLDAHLPIPEIVATILGDIKNKASSE